MTIMQIFKYTGTYGTKILKNCELKVSDPRDFNDPFEFCPHVVTAIKAADVAGKLNDIGFLKGVYEKNSEIKRQCSTVQDFLNSVEKEKNRWIEFFLKKFSDQDRFLPDTFAQIA